MPSIQYAFFLFTRSRHFEAPDPKKTMERNSGNHENVSERITTAESFSILLADESKRAMYTSILRASTMGHKTVFSLLGTGSLSLSIRCRAKRTMVSRVLTAIRGFFAPYDSPFA